MRLARPAPGRLGRPRGDAVPAAAPASAAGLAPGRRAGAGKAVRAVIVFDKNPKNPFDSRIIWKAFRGKRLIERAEWRAGSGFGGPNTNDPCARGRGWLPNGQVRLRAVRQLLGPVHQGPGVLPRQQGLPERDARGPSCSSTPRPATGTGSAATPGATSAAAGSGRSSTTTAPAAASRCHPKDIAPADPPLPPVTSAPASATPAGCTSRSADLSPEITLTRQKFWRVSVFAGCYWCWVGSNCWVGAGSVSASGVAGGGGGAGCPGRRRR